MPMNPPPLPQFQGVSGSKVDLESEFRKGENRRGNVSNLLGMVNPALGLASGVIGSIMSQNSADKQMQFQKEMAEQKHRWDVDAVLSNRAYNDPKAVMARLKRAGLNPDLMYGGASSLQNPAMASPASSPEGAHADPGSQLVAGASTGIQASMQSAQMRLADAQARNLDADSQKKEQETIGFSLSNEDAQISLGLRKATQSQELSARRAMFQKTEHEAQSVAQDVARKLFENKELLPAQRDELVSQYALNVANAALARAGADLKGKQREHYDALIANLYDASGKPVAWSSGMFSSLNTLLGGTDIAAKTREMASDVAGVVGSIYDSIKDWLSDPKGLPQDFWSQVKESFEFLFGRAERAEK